MLGVELDVVPLSVVSYVHGCSGEVLMHAGVGGRSTGPSRQGDLLH